ncbi:MAG: M10 family metallopeptidase C-terminal domain-containing protein, partial [Pseudomonadota bacterium]
MAYSDYDELLLSTNFIGGAGQGALPNPGSDDRAEVLKDGNDVYQFYYMALGSLTDMENLNYYDTPGSDQDSDLLTNDREYNELPTGNDPSLSATQLSILSSVINGDAYSSTFADVAMVNFNAGTTANSDIVIGQTTSGSGITSETQGYALQYNGAGGELKHGDIWLNEDATGAWDSSAEGSVGHLTMMHELGHALGLNEADLTPANDLDDPYYDSQQYTVMSYETLAGMDPAGADNEVMPFGLQLLDIAALQEIYGRNWDTRDTDTTYSKATAFASTRPNGAFIYTVWDGDGTDTIDVSGFTNTVGATVDLRQGEFSSVGTDADGNAAANNLAIAYHAVIENATGTAYGDTLIGNAWNNVLDGGAGNDTIYGDGLEYDNDSGFGTGGGEWDTDNPAVDPATDNSGADRIIGGTGDDTLRGGAGIDTYVYDFGDGDDTIVEDWSGDNLLEFGVGIDRGDMTVTESGDDLLFTFAGGGSVRFDGYVTSSNNGDVSISFDGGASSGEIIKLPGISATITGTYKDEIFIGNDANHNVDTRGGDDVLFLGDGNDSVRVSGGFDTVIAWGGAGNDVMSTFSQGTTYLYGEAGEDRIELYEDGIYIADMGSGNDRLNAGSFEDGVATITDNSGNEFYQGLGGEGDLSIIDTDGNDEYRWFPSLGDVNIKDTTGDDILRIQTAYWTFTSATNVGNDLVIDTTSFSKDLVISDYFDSDDNKIETVSFNDTGDFDLSDLLSGLNLVFGTTGDDSALNGIATGDAIYAYAGNDVLDGNAGNDLLYGAEGNDNYVFNAGDGQDTIEDTAGDDFITLGPGISSGDLTLTQVGDDLEITFSGTPGDKITIKDHYGAGTTQVEKIVFNDLSELNLTANNVNGTSGNDTLTGTSGQDVFNPGAGDDEADGGNGDDTFNYTDGFDEYDGGAGTDTVDYSGFGSAVWVKLTVAQH